MTSVISNPQPALPRKLENGLLLRRSSKDDEPKLSAFDSRIFADSETHQPDLRLKAWVTDLLIGGHPTFAADDFTIVEDRNSGEIVSSLCLLSQRWSFAGIPFDVGRPELAATDQRFRKQGLMRAQFDAIHSWSQARGQVLQAITGIPIFYRQFGYEMAVNLGGGRAGFEPLLPAAETNPRFNIRPARVEDYHFFQRCYQRSCQRSLLNSILDEDIYRYEIMGKRSQNITRWIIEIITSQAGENLGMLVRPAHPENHYTCADWFELKEGVSWYELTPFVLRHLWECGKTLEKNGQGSFFKYGLQLGEDHPAFRAAPHLLPERSDPYAWYLRLPDLPGFMRLITPVLEQRLAASIAPGYTGVIHLNFYYSGIKLSFLNGRLEVSPFTPNGLEEDDALFPGQTFLQILFGYRSSDELEYAFPDCIIKPAFRPILAALFPRQSSHIFEIF
jgi:hypothetical protein